MNNNDNSSFNILKVSKGQLDIEGGDFFLYAFLIYYDNHVEKHYALVNNQNWNVRKPIPFRINSACITSEVFGCRKCDCKWQLERAIEYIAKAGVGLITYHPDHEGLGHGIFEKLDSFRNIGETNYSYKELSCNEEDSRNFLPTKAILEYFKVKKVVFLGNNLNKKSYIESCGIEIVETKNLVYNGNNENTNKYILNKSYKPEHRALRKGEN